MIEPTGLPRGGTDRDWMASDQFGTVDAGALRGMVGSIAVVDGDDYWETERARP